MNATRPQWEDYYRQGQMYEWWRQHDDARVWAPLEHADRRTRYLVTEALHNIHEPQPLWLTDLVTKAISMHGLDLPAVRRYVDAHTPTGAAAAPAMVAEAYRREALHRHCGWAWKTLIPAL